MTPQRFSIVLLALATTGAFVMPAGAATSTTQPSAAAATQSGSLAEQFRSVKPPKVDQSRLQDRAYVTQLRQEITAYHTQRAELARQLLKADPNANDAPIWLEAVGMGVRVTGESDEALSTIDHVLKNATSPKVKTAALYERATALLYTPAKRAEFPAAAEAFLATADKKDRRAPGLLYTEIELAQAPAERKKLTDRLIADYPDSPQAEQAKAHARREESLGKPFELSFTDAISGKKIDVKDLKGKVLVIDFWATWCGPCVGEMPEMKKIYAEYHGKGVEFLGVSLDQPEAEGGLKKLKDFCKEKEIAWPQYYQGNGWESDFSKSWGIDSIPTMFVVDADGKLADVQARGRLPEILPKLIAKRDGKPATGARE